MRVRVALRRNVERLFGDRAPELTPYLAAMLGLALEPDAQARLGELSPEALQYRTFEVVRHWLQRLAEDGPVAVALEDLHWADATSLQLLERLLPDTETSALLLVLTLRQERDHPAWRLKEDASQGAPAPDDRDGAGGAVGRRGSRPAPLARRRRHAARRHGGADPRARRRQPVLPRGARPLARRLGLARPGRGRLALRSRRRGRDPADRREGDPRADRPARSAAPHRADGCLRPRAGVRAAAPGGGERRTTMSVRRSRR